MAETVKKTETKSTKTTIKKVRTSPKIYIGPNLPEMIKYTVISDGVPFHVKAAIEKCPSIEKLIVDVTAIAEKESKIAKKGTLEHRFYQEIIDFTNRKGDE